MRIGCEVARNAFAIAVIKAADLDFELTVLADACLDADPEVHRVPAEKIFPAQAEVTTESSSVPGRM